MLLNVLLAGLLHLFRARRIENSGKLRMMRISSTPGALL
jgi:hypothetical protein